MQACACGEYGCVSSLLPPSFALIPHSTQRHTDETSVTLQVRFPLPPLLTHSIHCAFHNGLPPRRLRPAPEKRFTTRTASMRFSGCVLPSPPLSVPVLFLTCIGGGCRWSAKKALPHSRPASASTSSTLSSFMNVSQLASCVPLPLPPSPFPPFFFLLLLPPTIRRACVALTRYANLTGTTSSKPSSSRRRTLRTTSCVALLRASLLCVSFLSVPFSYIFSSFLCPLSLYPFLALRACPFFGERT